jgi:di/tricarboxylate transporter
MKACLDCGAEAPNSQMSCDVCKRPTAWRITGPDDVDAPRAAFTPETPAQWVRPDGRSAIAGGSAAVILGIICVLISFMINPYEYGQVDAGALRWQWGLLFFGAGIAQIGLMLWLAGYIVKAISFLPGRDD